MALSCSNCGKELPDDAKFCAECGTQVSEEKPKPHFCLHCGVLLTENAKFCLACGTPITEDETSWREKKDKAFEKELIQESPVFDRERGLPERGSGYIFDFEETKAFIAVRAQKWAEYACKRMSAPEWFDTIWLGSLRNGKFLDEPWQEQFYFKTNKPNAHKALVLKIMNEKFIYEALMRYYIRYEGDLLPTVATYYKLTHSNFEDLDDWLEKSFQFRNEYPDLDELAKKDDELFPPPEPLREEVAGAILNFMSNEVVLVVYMDCSLSGKRVEIEIDDLYISSAYGYDQRRVEILERSGSGVAICAAIFNRIPFVTDTHRNRQEVLKQIQVSVKFSSPDNQKWEEKVTLFQGKVSELDWRGRTPQPKVQPQPQQTTIPATPSNTATLQGAKITLKNVDHNADECVYYIEVEDPGY